MKVVIIDDERYPDYYISSNVEKDSVYGEIIDVPEEFYELFLRIEAQRELTQRLASAYLRKDNLTIVELTAKLKGLI